VPHFVQEGGHPLCAGGETGADADEAVDVVGKEPENRPDAGADVKVRFAVEAGAGRQIGGIEKPGWPKVSRSCRSCEYVKKNTAFELTSASEMVWLFNVTPWYDPKPTLNTTEILSVNVNRKC
jgi:hypothetical protein